MCVFCDKTGLKKEEILFDTINWIAKEDLFPVSKGHTLLISKEHYTDYFSLPDSLKESMHYMIERIKNALDEKYHPNGYNIGANCGEAAGQTVNHFHLHIIPRYNGDVENPRGGVRGVIPSKQNY